MKYPFLFSILYVISIYLAFFQAQAIQLDINDDDSVRNAVSSMTGELMNYWNGSDYKFVASYWWVTGASMTALLNNDILFGNNTYTDLVSESLLYNAGSDHDYQPSDEYFNLGNDDQGIWGTAAMDAAELDLKQVKSSTASWLELSQAAFNRMSGRWDNVNCEGGLRWQAFPWLSGYSYKSSISNGLLFQLAARLARFTHESSYEDWVHRVWDWSTSSGFVNETDFSVYDGSSVATNCTDIDHSQWSYNLGVYMTGAAYMYNHTQGSDLWKNRLDGFISHAISSFTKDGVAWDPQCETSNTCNIDQTAFKGILMQSFGNAIRLAPYTRNKLYPLIKTSAPAAALACSGGYSGSSCGVHWSWNNGTWDGTYGVGQQFSALEAVQMLYVDKYPSIVTLSSSSDNRSNATYASDNSSTKNYEVNVPPATEADRGGAGFLTFLSAFLLLGASVWAIIEDEEGNIPSRIHRSSSQKDEKDENVMNV
ncbi:mannan endo-1,6-alpha-mannosidase [Schizosaccharomyces cryophilus OY26]|uniref:Mannan endo-1,6-alpha-mannosidase n=1 Tax=Schizosaccharomyces cryophilus (strain OY26 / ATCC MYA-4695 / CBS 11777 / NBRC 106824 / NRRL Y48691) TaxID=653667 RepID=S9VNN4_SCHCR|nr:mannan endo-1,6-alpha-mannosidase [Schizosaccharomyces cryophilus OY26]EPY49583.1 mannan endo-1,6-alpha-mannosidase [Schizosaccharomyces cryophilus OY26]